MPVENLTKKIALPYTVRAAKSFRGRLIGLLGTREPDPGQCVLFDPCKGVHTFGMNYPVDVVFLDDTSTVIEVLRNLQPGKITKPVRGARRVLEIPSGNGMNGKKFQTGDTLKIIADEEHRPDLSGLNRLLRWPVNLSMALLWSVFVLSSAIHWHQNGGVFSLGLVFVNTLLVILFLTRRESTETSSRIPDWVIPVMTVGASLMLRSSPSPIASLRVVSAVIQSIGITAIMISLLSLGKSFGIIPANRGIKKIGMYKLIRHPLYASEIVFYVGFMIGNATAWNFSLVCLVLLGQIYRAHSEEKLLGRQNAYNSYTENVKYRFIPGVF